MRIQTKDIIRFRSQGEILEGEVTQQTFGGNQIAVTIEVREKCFFTKWISTADIITNVTEETENG